MEILSLQVSLCHFLGANRRPKPARSEPEKVIVCSLEAAQAPHLSPRAHEVGLRHSRGAQILHEGQ